MFCTSWFAAPQYVVKIVEPDAKGEEEAAICEFLQRSRALESPNSNNHTIPCDVVHAEKTVLVMPYLPSMKALSATLRGRLWLESFLGLAYQLLEVLTYLPPGGRARDLVRLIARSLTDPLRRASTTSTASGSRIWCVPTPLYSKLLTY